jgi:hypothetical protein
VLALEIAAAFAKSSKPKRSILVIIGSRRLSTELGDLAEAGNKRGEHSFRLD